MSQLKYYDTGSAQWLPVLAGSQGTTGTQGIQGLQGASIQGVQGATGSVTTTPAKTVTTFTATDGQTTFTVSYTVGYIDVYLNGVRLSAADYTATNGTSVVLGVGATVGDVVDVVLYTMGLGAQGTQGLQGNQGFGYTQLQGVQGTTGSQGIQGSVGAQGTTSLSFNAQTGTTYTLASTDVNNLVTASNASAITITVPPSIFATGQLVNVQQIGAGQVTFAQGSGVTITSTGATSSAPKLRVTYSAATVICTGSNTFTIIGDLS